MICAGIGYRSQATAVEIADLVQRACAELGVARIDTLAVPGFKPADDAAPEQAAAALEVRLVRVDTDALAAAAPRCRTRSARAMPGCGHASAAEAAALAAAGPDAVLIAPRLAGPAATCALAVTAQGNRE